MTNHVPEALKRIDTTVKEYLTVEADKKMVLLRFSMGGTPEFQPSVLAFD